MFHKFSALFGLLFCLSAHGEPAPYYLWMSKVDGTRVCAQTSLGEGWQRMDGPFRDSLCRKRSF